MYEPPRQAKYSFLDIAMRFFRLEASGGILLMIAALIAIVIANSDWWSLYNYFLNDVNFSIGFSDQSGAELSLDKSVLLWINDGLMAIFFFLVGLEIKREMVTGELSSRDQALLPVLAAIGGMAVPAAIYTFINAGSPETLNGWAIPSATDIAFSLGILALLGSRVPIGLKVLLTAIAIIDDLGAILIIAFFYSGDILMTPLYVAAVSLAALVFLNKAGVSRVAPYILIGFVMWIAMLKSGIHPTIAGVLTALCIPMSSRSDPDHNPVEMLEHYLHPWVAFMILPVFAFANAGVSFAGMTLQSFTEPVTFGIIAGLVAGKVIGIFTTVFVAVKSGLCPMPRGTDWGDMWGMAHLCGIGFTMSLFIGELALQGNTYQAEIRLGVLTGSILSAVIAYLILRLTTNRKADQTL